MKPSVLWRRRVVTQLKAFHATTTRSSISHLSPLLVLLLGHGPCNHSHDHSRVPCGVGQGLFTNIHLDASLRKEQHMVYNPATSFDEDVGQSE